MNGEGEHREVNFENYVVSKLKAQGWEVGNTKGYDTERAIYPEDLEAWLSTTQPQKWSRLKAEHPDGAIEAVMDRLVKTLESDGTVYALRRGFSMAPVAHIDLSEAAPEDKRDEDSLKRYAANILRVVPQLKYHPSRELALDLAFFINGLPVATVEIKTDFTQSIDDAVEQYKRDRLPVDPKTRRKEPLLTFKRGAVVHFALSDSEIRMTTKLDGEKTYFLPFNQGDRGHAGNPARTDGEYPVAYFWETVCQRDNWLRIFHSFVYAERKSVTDLQGNHSTQETQIFPRYHQWDAVNKMIADAKSNGAGMSYLCEHSAGSGKTSTIAWTAHDLIKLRTDDGEEIFSSVIIVTDRTVLDSQLQEAVKQIDHQFGTIAAIDREGTGESKSKQLADALAKKVPIIVVTIQTFPHAMEAILLDKKLKGKNFAVIVDEAHNSQTGTNATKLQAALALTGKAGTASLTLEEILAELQTSRKRPKNLSHFAFTATPKHSTYMLFGRTADGKKATDENKPRPFHLYPMRQAIEEGFIMDVLENYTSYKTAFNLATKVVDEKRVGNKAAKRALAKWMTLHPTNVTQKVEFIIEHFANTVAHLLDGKAKAMVVTSSRAAVIRYKKGFDAFIGKHPEYSHIKSLVAFSGKLQAKDVMHPDDPLLKDDPFVVDENAEFTEGNMNPGIPSPDLRVTFNRPEYRVMLVADKFQTGFDQPKLVAMYVDKKIANDVEIVQTLSRLNRTATGKDTTYVIDFANEPENVRKAFAKYDAGAVLQEIQDPNVVYDIKQQLDAQGLYTTEDLEGFKRARFQSLRELASAKGLEETDPRHKAMYAATERAKRLYEEKFNSLRNTIAEWEKAFQKAKAAGNEDGAARADHEREIYEMEFKGLLDFKNGLGRFVRTYGYIAQLADLGDADLEAFAAFAKLLQKRLKGVPSEHVDLKGLVLSGYSIKRQDEEGKPDDKAVPVLKPIGAGGEGKEPDPKQYLHEIIERLNHLFGEATPIQDRAAFVSHVTKIAREDAVTVAQIENNTREQAMKGNLRSTVEKGVVRAMRSHQELATQVLKSDKQGMDALVDLVYDLIRLKNIAELENLTG